MQPPIVDAQGMSLLQTKFYVPLVRRERVPRPALVERLNAGLHRTLTLISAPAGFGADTVRFPGVRMAPIVKIWTMSQIR